MTQQDDRFRDDTPFGTDDRLAGEGSTDVDSPMGDGSDAEEKAVGGGAGVVGAPPSARPWADRSARSPER
jgi:hypothetical protein